MTVKQYKVEPMNQYAQYPAEWLEASSPKAALQRYLKMHGIGYNTIMANSPKNRDYLNRLFGYRVCGMELAMVWQFLVSPKETTLSSGGMYALDVPGYQG